MVVPKRVEALTSVYCTKVVAHLTTNYVLSQQEAQELVPTDITQWGKHCHAFGEMIHAAELVSTYRNEFARYRNASWIEVCVYWVFSLLFSCYH